MVAILILVVIVIDYSISLETPPRRLPSIISPVGISNILKAKTWKLALTRTPDPIRPPDTWGVVLTVTDPRGFPPDIFPGVIITLFIQST